MLLQVRRALGRKLSAVLSAVLVIYQLGSCAACRCSTRLGLLYLTLTLALIDLGRVANPDRNPVSDTRATPNPNPVCDPNPNPDPDRLGHAGGVAARKPQRRRHLLRAGGHPAALPAAVRFHM